jgi:hypothetical protein
MTAEIQTALIDGFIESLEGKENREGKEVMQRDRNQTRRRRREPEGLSEGAGV